MTEKNQQEKNAAERQVELLVNAFDKAQENGGVWLNKESPSVLPERRDRITIQCHYPGLA